MRMAVRTLVFTPTASRAELRARELITVAHMPIWSPFTRSKPFDAPLRPRKMLPPPMTMPICTPISLTSLIWSAYCERRSGSMPKLCLPIRLSPLSFKRILLNFVMSFIVCFLFFTYYFLLIIFYLLFFAFCCLLILFIFLSINYFLKKASPKAANIHNRWLSCRRRRSLRILQIHE